jgi:alpha-tubulin suppressor-like RCC1 family protein
VRGGLKFASVSVGAEHTCALTAGGVAYCWGDNQLGQLGDTAVVGATAPHPVAGSLTFLGLDAGGAHSCGITRDRVARCWGADGNGQLGGPATNTCIGPSAAGPCSPIPQAVTGTYSFAVISAGNQHTCALTTDQRAFCWGLNSNGQLGGSAAAASTTPVAVAVHP